MVLVDASVWFVELLMGAERSNRKPDVLGRLDALTRVVSVHYGVNRLVCEHYVLQFTRLRAAGTPLGANDLWIASYALADDCTPVTNNTREFERAMGLRLENWAETAEANAVG